MPATTTSGDLPDACGAILLDLQTRVHSAQQTWIAAKAATAQAVANEQAALQAFHAARRSFDDTSIALSRVYGTHGMLACPQPPSSTSASSITSDVLSEIFRHMMLPYTYDRFGETDIEHPAFVVSSVSRHWRRAALATPSIWTKVRLPFNERMWDYVKAYVELSLARSGGLLLDLFVCLMETHRTWLPEDEQAIVHLLSRCGTIHVEIANDDISFAPSIIPRLQA
ncbi:hypothetical protein AURDEDRAFT_171433 [Auricularia subglabra TFB-10046 SS5]|nr:hypothetical protein AURDEDRAFT_171433 [Auricularia subglabra TFB-10046 SS5]